MATLLRRRKEFQFARAELDWTAELRLRAAERVLENGADTVRPQLAIPFGRRTVILWQYRGLAIYFHWLDEVSISLDLVIDIGNPPDWFVRPSGTWFERYGHDFDESFDNDLIE
jgi:hypothetical protein